MITELGLKLLEMIDQIAKALYEFETIESDRYCFLCGEAKMKIDCFQHVLDFGAQNVEEAMARSGHSAC